MFSSRFVRAVFAGSFLLTSMSVQAAPLMPVSYDMLNGNLYLDESYDGAGDPGTSLSPLSGGTGELTDGVIATLSWNTVHQPRYVGWFSIDPEITFNFEQDVQIDSITLWFEDFCGQCPNTAKVGPPSSVTIDGTNYLVPDPPGSDPFPFTVDGLGFTGSTLDIQIFDGLDPDLDWVFLSEVEFDGTAVIPIPGAFVLLLSALGGIGLTARRRNEPA